MAKVSTGVQHVLLNAANEDWRNTAKGRAFKKVHASTRRATSCPSFDTISAEQQGLATVRNTELSSSGIGECGT
jgi:hypothetical protein